MFLYLELISRNHLFQQWHSDDKLNCNFSKFFLCLNSRESHNIFELTWRYVVLRWFDGQSKEMAGWEIEPFSWWDEGKYFIWKVGVFFWKKKYRCIHNFFIIIIFSIKHIDWRCLMASLTKITNTFFPILVEANAATVWIVSILPKFFIVFKFTSTILGMTSFS